MTQDEFNSCDVFCLRDSEWQIRIGNHVLPHIWNSRGAALAGLKTEEPRRERRGINPLIRGNCGGT